MDLADAYSEEEIAEREAEIEREQLADLGMYDPSPQVCSLCLGLAEGGELCDPCADYSAWQQTQQTVGG